MAVTVTGLDGGDLEDDVAGDDVGGSAVEVLADVGSEASGGGEQDEAAGVGAADFEGAVRVGEHDGYDGLPWISWTRAPPTAAPSGSVTMPRTMTLGAGWHSSKMAAEEEERAWQSRVREDVRCAAGR